MTLCSGKSGTRRLTWMASESTGRLGDPQSSPRGIDPKWWSLPWGFPWGYPTIVGLEWKIPSETGWDLGGALDLDELGPQFGLNPCWSRSVSPCSSKQTQGSCASRTYISLAMKLNPRSLPKGIGTELTRASRLPYNQAPSSFHVLSGWWFGTSILFSQKYWVSNHPNWRTHIFQRGG